MATQRRGRAGGCDRAIEAFSRRRVEREREDPRRREQGRDGQGERAPEVCEHDHAHHLRVIQIARVRLVEGELATRSEVEHGEIERSRALAKLQHDNAALDARVVGRAIELGEMRDRYLASEAEVRRLQDLVRAAGA